MNNYIGFFLAALVCSIPAFLFSSDFPIPSAYLLLALLTNLIFSFASIFMQTIILRLYEINVYEEKKGILDYTFHYLAMFFSGVNYHIQLIFNRTPFILNKLFACIFCFFSFFLLFAFVAIYD